MVLPTVYRGAASSSSPYDHSKKRWNKLVPILVALVVVAEIVFLGRLDMAKNAAMMRTWTAGFNSPVDAEKGIDGLGVIEESVHEIRGWSCEEWLEREDSVTCTRDFKRDPIWVNGGEQDWKSCSVGCTFANDRLSNRKPDAAFGLHGEPETASVLRSMESSHYYSENNLDHARRKGYNVVMTTSLSSDVPVGYFSWAEYDIMAPVQPKTEKSPAAAFISNCGARNFRLEALELLEKMNIQIDSYGGCHRNHDGRVDKVKALKRYKFSLAFENSNEEDYVTEKFFQSLVAGTIPVVVGAPNIQDFAPAPGSILHIKEVDDVPSVAKNITYLASNPVAFNNSLRWKYEGPSDSFKALVDMAAVHSSCRLCIHLATQIREKKERSNPNFQKRPCNCTRSGVTVHHLFVRERGRFEMESIFLSSSSLTLQALESAVLAKFKSLNHVPIWKGDRPSVIKGGDDLKIYRIYPLGMTQRQALYTFSFKGDGDLQYYIESNPCAKLEVIFV
ncbi:hypothetical protein AMTRI_Chr04g247480 [Amborella trichopoda]|uniref:Fucosyltransferase n=1 Tax=Amborella trichopoda TaxID=13333 RepID=W1NDR3_AMBTC|nr:putative fucosyltransferase-like protein [Amborella trichopoda]ERM93474.1 hypothetical protein AMTR_s00132p00113370 [Amborella trichopoda]|eukprot:XP_006826237.1 putative fucosyltransferase-like protein [Amborella trichopoda]